MANALARFLGSARIRSVLNAAQKLLGLAAIVFLGIKLYHIGWPEILASLPREPAFYIAFAVIYLLAPLAEVLIYSSLWGIGLSALPTFLRKRIYNEIVIDYSGEAYLFLWAQRNIPGTDVRTLSAIKDVNLLSGIASNAVTLALLVVFALGGYASLLKGIDPDVLRGVSIAAGVAVTIMLAVVLFGHRILGVSRAQCYRIGGIHFVRMVLVLLLQTVMWGSALPDVPWSQWVLLLTAQMLLTRLPFIPNRDIVMMWLGVTLAPSIAAPQAHVASRFVAAGALSLVTHACIFALTSFLQHRQPKVQPA